MKTTQHRSIVLGILPAGLLVASAFMTAYTPAEYKASSKAILDSM